MYGKNSASTVTAHTSKCKQKAYTMFTEIIQIMCCSLILFVELQISGTVKTDSLCMLLLDILHDSTAKIPSGSNDNKQAFLVALMRLTKLISKEDNGIATINTKFIKENKTEKNEAWQNFNLLSGPVQIVSILIYLFIICKFLFSQIRRK